jgi:hypothetical protein
VWYAQIKGIDGKWRQVCTDFVEGQEAERDAWIRAREAEIARELRRRGPDVMTFATFARRWYTGRMTISAALEKGRIENHLIPVIGDKPLADLTCGDGEDVLRALQQKDLGGRTINGILTQGHGVMEAASAKGLHVGRNPFKLRPGIRPAKVDRDPSWRRQAIYTRAECRVLLKSRAIPRARRILYALKFLAMLRHGEASSLTWGQWVRRKRRPDSPKLSGLALRHTKTKIPREVPVHPVLEQMLRKWFRVGWERTYGRKPEPTDLIVPNRYLRQRTAKRAQVSLVGDLRRHGLRVTAGVGRSRKGARRHRRGHDLRRTGITLWREHGCGADLLQFIAWGPSKKVVDQYTSPRWIALSVAMRSFPFKLGGKLPPTLREPTKRLPAGCVAEVRAAQLAAASAGASTDGTDGRALNPTSIDEDRNPLSKECWPCLAR